MTAAPQVTASLLCKNLSPNDNSSAAASVSTLTTVSVMSKAVLSGLRGMGAALLAVPLAASLLTAPAWASSGSGGSNVVINAGSMGPGINPDGTVDPAFASSVSEQMAAYTKNITLDSFNSLPKSRITKMREAYIQAENAFKRGEEALGFNIQREQLKGYPLNIWLTYYYLAYNIRIDKFEAVLHFIESGEQKELAENLKERYAEFLEKERDFVRLAQLVGPKPFDENKVSSLSFKQKKQMCRFYEANWPLGKVNEAALSFAARIYLDLGQRPESCNILLTQFDAKGYLSDSLMLKRFEKAYVQRSYQDTTKSLANNLVTTEFGSRIKAQMELYETPGKLFELIKGNNEEEHRVAVLAFKRYANLAPKEARLDFERFNQIFKPSATELIDICQIFAGSFLGRSYDLDDVLWVDQNLPALAWTTELKEQRLRRAIYFAQWDKVYFMIDMLPEDLQHAVNWKYWKGRAALELGRDDEGRRILTEVAQDRSFFGFYAAQSLDLDYAFNYVKIDPKFSFPLDIAHNKAAVRFFELYALDDDNAIYEWREIARHSPEREAMVMAQWALQTGNINYAIDFVVSSGKWDALDYRFPIAYRELYEKSARDTGVPISFLYGISRQESMLNHKIRSWAGAIGLMQVMPGTARDIARKEKWKFQGNSSLVDPETNIKYGSTYIKWMLDKFDHNRILAAAAYNAGPGRIPQWTSDDGQKRDAAMFVETIPFKETRKYVQNVLLYDAIYEYLLTGKPGTLLEPAELSYAY